MLRTSRHLSGASPVSGAPDAGVSAAPSIRRAIAQPDATPAALVELAQAGDRAAFEALVERHLDREYRRARAILGNDADARDATQEAFVHAWRELPRLRQPERFDAWLTSIVVNGCRQSLRGRRRRSVREIAASDLGDGYTTVAAADDPPDDQAASADALARAFEGLSAGERAILVLHHLEHRPLAEISTTLAIPVGTAKSRLSAARRALGRALEVELR